MSADARMSVSNSQNASPIEPPSRKRPPSMDESAELFRIVGLLYDSVIEEAMWPVALQALTDFTGGTGAGEVVANPTTGIITHTQAVSVDPSFRDLYLEHYATKEVRLPPAIRFPVGAVIVENMLLERKELERSELYGGLLLPCDVPHFMFAWLQKETHAFHTVAIEGSKRHGAFEGDAIRRFTQVMPHLIRAVRMRDLLISARQSNHAYEVLLDSLPLGVVYFDDKGKLTKVSAAAEKLFQQGDALSCVKGQMHAQSPDDNRELQRAILTICDRRSSRTLPGNTIVVRRVNALRPLVVTVIPSGASQLLISLPSIAGMMLVVDPEQTPRPRADLIQRAFGLTKSEAKLANFLFEGNSLRDTAEHLGRSINTCKSQLKAIYAKTGCSSHVDLAKKLMMVALGRLSCHMAFALMWLPYLNVVFDSDA
jgi:DNA-binding CsgD family transcriptional regulator/PAS domain-containing protein